MKHEFAKSETRTRRTGARPLWRGGGRFVGRRYGRRLVRANQEQPAKHAGASEDRYAEARPGERKLRVGRTHRRDPTVVVVVSSAPGSVTVVVVAAVVVVAGAVVVVVEGAGQFSATVMV